LPRIARRDRRPWYIDPVPYYLGLDGNWHYFGRPAAQHVMRATPLSKTAQSAAAQSNIMVGIIVRSVAAIGD
jgi:hypothetical protein